MTSMTAQEIFNKAVTGVLEQGKPSINVGGKCLYRGPNGIKCAAGHVIRDEDYNSEWDTSAGGLSIKSVSYDYDNTPLYISENIDLIEALQDAHDSEATSTTEYWMEDFKNACKKIAKKHDLDMPQILLEET